MLGGYTDFEKIVAELKALSRIFSLSLEFTTGRLTAIWKPSWRVEHAKINSGPLQFPIDSPSEVGKTVILGRCSQLQCVFL